MPSETQYKSSTARSYRVRRQARGADAPDTVAFATKPKSVDQSAPEPSDTIALIAFHGMGNQIEFQTLDQVAEGLLRVQADLNGVRPAPSVESIRADDLLLRRLSFTLSRSGVTRHVDLYEVYWAPFTEGQVVLRDVLSFLIGAGLNATRRFSDEFKRWIFGRFEPFPIPRSTRFSLMAALAVVVSLVFLNTAAGALYAMRFADTSPAWLTAGLLKDITTALGALAAMYLLFGILLGAGVRVRNARRKRAAKPAPGSFAIPALLAGLIRWTFRLSLAVTIFASALAAVILVKHRLGPEEPALLGSPEWLGQTWTMVLVWILLLAASYVIRRFLIQYVGDVVAYVYSFTLDKFYDLRKSIKDRATETARAVYGLLNDDAVGTLRYRKVLMVGHSLGSVVAYDTLNRLLDDDAAAAKTGSALDVMGRTSMLLTFGSPLDKTAYLFRTQQHSTGAAREALAAAAQPLINDPCFRPPSFKWLNIFAPKGNDLIGASVDFYQPMTGFPNPVQNVADPDASIPVIAHTEYWHNPLIWRELHDRIMTC